MLKYWLIARVDFGIIKNFISIFLFNKKRFFIWKKKDANNLLVINRNQLLSKNGKIDEKTELLLFITQQYKEKIIFDII